MGPIEKKRYTKRSEQKCLDILDSLCKYQVPPEGFNFRDIKGFLCEDVLEILSKYPGRWKSLAEIYDSMADASRLQFLHRCFQLRHALSVNELTALWYKCFEDDEGLGIWRFPQVKDLASPHYLVSMVMELQEQYENDGDREYIRNAMDLFWERSCIIALNNQNFIFIR